MIYPDNLSIISLSSPPLLLWSVNTKDMQYFFQMHGVFTFLLLPHRYIKVPIFRFYLICGAISFPSIFGLLPQKIEISVWDSSTLLSLNSNVLKRLSLPSKDCWRKWSNFSCMTLHLCTKNTLQAVVVCRFLENLSYGCKLISELLG